MLVDILNTIKKEHMISHQQLARLFSLEDAVLEDMINILCKKKLIVLIADDGVLQDSEQGCNSFCDSCSTSVKNNWLIKKNCYYKITKVIKN